MSRLGVSTQLIAGGDIFPALEKGVIDAFVDKFGTEHGLPEGVVFPTYGLAESTVMVTCNGRARARVDPQRLASDRVAEDAGAGGDGVWIVGCGRPRRDRGVDVIVVSNAEDDA